MSNSLKAGLKKTVPSHKHSWVSFSLLCICLAIAAAPRLIALGQNAYVLDECWSLEISSARGSLHMHIPLDSVIRPAPVFFSLDAAPPWWKIWTNMEVTHPPLYSLLLRGWERVIGTGDVAGRLFSVLAAVLGLAVLFDVVRLQAGTTPAVWACLLMAAACPQVEYARLARSYTLLLAVMLVSANLLLRIQLLGMSRRRLILLSVSIFCSLLTHYFCAGTVIALLAYALWALPAHRRSVILAFSAAALVFGVVWGPCMWEQQRLFSTADPATSFLSWDVPDHGRVTLLRFLLAPAGLLFPVTGAMFYVVGGLLYSIAFLRRVRRETPSAVLWGLWLAGTILPLLCLDLFRRTNHLDFVRYTLLAGPAVYALIPLTSRALVGRYYPAITALVLILCLWHLPAVYGQNPRDPRALIRELITPPGPEDLLVIASSKNDALNDQIELLLIQRYLEPVRCPVLILTRPATGQTLSTVQRSRLVFLITRGEQPGNYLGKFRIIHVGTYPGLGFVWTLQM